MENENLAYVGKIQSLEKDLQNSLEFIKYFNYIKKDSTVFVKPNFTFPFYQKGVTTSPNLLEHLLGLLKDRADRVIIGESDGGNRSFTASQAFDGHNMHEICRQTGAELVNLSIIPSETVKSTVEGKTVQVQLPQMLLYDIDCFISVPVLKVHVMTNVSLSMKNLWGCYPDTMRGLYHKNLSRKLALITRSLNPKIIVIDGTYALDKHGPMYGTPVKTNLLISANNPVVADSIGSAIMGIPPSNVDHILMAEKIGLGSSDLSKITLNDDWKQYSQQFEVNKTMIDRLSWILFNSETCAKIVMDSRLSPIIYKIGTKLRNTDEKFVAKQLNREIK